MPDEKIPFDLPWWTNPSIRHEPKDLVYFPYADLYRATIDNTNVELPILWIRERMLFDDVDVIALVANLVNMLAKVDPYKETGWFDEDCEQFWYEIKAWLLEVILALDMDYPHLGVGFDDMMGILYIETPVGQVSFHVMEERLDDALIDSGFVRRGYEWSGIPNQFEAPNLLLELYNREGLV